MSDQRVKLLIVDDDASIRELLASLFSELGYCARSVKDGISALSEIRHELPDLMFSGINNRDLTGVEFLRVVRRLYPSIRVIAMSDESFGDSVPTGIAADAFFEQCSDINQLIESADALTRPGHSAKRLSMEDLFGFPMYETIPLHPGAGRLKNSAGQTNYQFLASQENESLGFS
jgi:CheY-like chemotaxis protein